ncbi:MAG: hypothetical protein HY295_03970 [Thaumarchaeota archaeon]|nr:hypothetical protein [Nitrososphaerota archaeon]
MNYKLLYLSLAASLILIPILVNHPSEAKILTIRGYQGLTITNGLTIQDKSFKLTAYSNAIPTTTVEIGKNVNLKLRMWDDLGTSQKIHAAIYTNLNGASREVADSNTFVVFDTDKPVQVSDPSGLFSTVNVSVSKEGNYFEVSYDLTFAKPMKKSDIIIRVWDESLKVEETKASDALEVQDAAPMEEKMTEPMKENMTETMKGNMTASMKGNMTEAMKGNMTETMTGGAAETNKMKEKMMEKGNIESPRMQVAHGVAAHDVKCKDGFELVLKSKGGAPACVKSASVQSLIERGWAMARSIMNEKQ